MKKAVILGGTFDPPHLGHLRILKEARVAVSADKAFMIPTYTPPHKSANGVSSAEKRLDMCRVAAESIGATVLDIEIKRGGKSYTVDTLEELEKLYPGYEFYLVMGSDMLATLPTWRRYDEILRRTKIVAFMREGVTFEQLEEFAEAVRKDGGEVILLDTKPDGISSTNIRNRLKKGQDVSCMLPGGLTLD